MNADKWTTASVLFGFEDAAGPIRSSPACSTPTLGFHRFGPHSCRAPTFMARTRKSKYSSDAHPPAASTAGSCSHARTLGLAGRGQRGSHIILTRPGVFATLSVPDHPQVARGTLRAVIAKA